MKCMQNCKNIVLIGVFLILFSCKNDNDLVPVQIPEREEKSIHKLTNPEHYKATGNPFKLYPLPFPFDTLTSPLGGENLEFHYSKVYLNYTNRINKLVTQKDIADKTISEICKEVTTEETELKNIAGAFYNHTLFFELLTPNLETKPSEILNEAFIQDFGSFANFKKEFQHKANSSFGSNWAWLIIDNQKKLQIITTTNENNPLMKDALVKGKPLIALDLWEHAYISDYKNQKSAYINAFTKHINWDIVSDRYDKLLK